MIRILCWSARVLKRSFKSLVVRTARPNDDVHIALGLTHDQILAMTFQLTNSSYQTKIHQSKRSMLRTSNLALRPDVQDDLT